MFGPIAQSPIAALVPLDPTTRVLEGVLEPPQVVFTGSSFDLLYILTPRPPVSLKEARRAALTDNGWVSVVQVAEYKIPASLAAPERIVSTRYILSRLTAASVTGAESTLAVRVIDMLAGDTFTLFRTLTVPATGFLDLPLQSAVVGPQQIVQVRLLTGPEVHVTANYVNSTRESFTVLP
jgi:hypothetical protein